MQSNHSNLNKEYYINFLHHKPFYVVIDNNLVYVYKKNINNKYITPVAAFKPSKLFIGLVNNDINNDINNDSNNDGNSILLNIKDNTYIFIGENIYSFTSYAKIIKFFSPIIDNISFPYAIDINNNYYLFIENIVMKSDEFFNNPYHFYYNIISNNDLIVDQKLTLLTINDMYIIHHKLY